MTMQSETQSVWRFGVLDQNERLPRLSGADKAVAEWATIEEHERVLDLHCAQGALLANLTEKLRLRACGICDTAEQAHALRGMLSDADVLCARPVDIPWRDGAFDAVISGTAAQNYMDFEQVLDEVLRVLRPGGQFVISAPYSFDDAFSPRTLMRKLQQAGFQNVSWRSRRLNGVCIAWKESIKDE